MKFTQLKVPTMVLAVIALVVGVSSGAVAAKLITGADVKNESLQSKDIQNGTLVTGDLKQSGINGNRLATGTVTGNRIKDGTIGPNDLSTTAFGPNWSIVDRNVIGNGDSYLRSGPTVLTLAGGTSGPPLGIGSLGVRTGSPQDKAAFGDQIDFAGQRFSAVAAVGYSVFATGEDFLPPDGSPTNLPSISFELNFNPNGVLDFHTVFYAPSIGATDVNQWTAKDAVADATPHWGITGLPAGSDCDANGTLCTFAELQAAITAQAPDATILTAQITKGRDFAFSGAVDALQVNDQVFDFEPFGVTVTTPTP